MKNSRYNTFFTKEGKIIGYNSVSDNFIILEPLLHDLFDASVNENKIHELKNVHIDLFNVLVDNGFLVKDTINELEHIKEISYKTDFNESHYKLIINPTMNCNFKCWYCYETHIKDSKMSQETLTKVTKYIDTLLQEKKGVLKDFHLSWFGGEPLLYFDKVILPLLKNVYPKMETNNINFHSGFTTNGLLLNQKILDNCKKYRVTGFQITLDGHRERHNKVRFVSKTRGSYDKIVENIKLCLTNKFKVGVRINISEETISSLLYVIDDFKDVSIEDREYLIFNFHEVWQEKKDLTTEIKRISEEFRNNNFATRYKEDVVSLNNSCYADKINQAVINYNGDVFKCTARDYETKSREGVLEESGVITWNETLQKRMYDTRFKNKPCLECKILPICNGSCSQKRMENDGIDYCIYNFDEELKLNVIKERFIVRIG